MTKKTATTNLTVDLREFFGNTLLPTEPRPINKARLDLFLHGKYPTPRNFRVSIPCLIEVLDYAVFQTEPGTLDKVITSAGLQNEPLLIERCEAHESKIKQEIRRTGKELSRKELTELDSKGAPKPVNPADSTNPDEKKKGKQDCHIPDAMCGKCLDCRTWGFAAQGGDETGQPAVVEVGTAYTIRQVDEIMRDRIGNAIDENARHVLQAFFTKEQVTPQVFLPYVLDLKDVNLDQLVYILYSLYNANRIGAGSTKAGSIEIMPMGIYFTYEALFVNLKLTKLAYDHLAGKFEERHREVSQEAKDKAKKLGWLGALTKSQVQEALQTAIESEYAAATCPCWRLSDETFKQFDAKCLTLFKDETQLHALMERNNG